MKLFMYTHWNKEHEMSGNIIFDDHNVDEFKVAMERACKTAELPKLKEAKRNCKLVFLGIYDDATMKFEVTDEPVVLIDFDEIISHREVYENKLKDLASKEVKDGE